MNRAHRSCKQCGAEVTVGSRFCSRCGQALLFCLQCGAVLDPEARFCSQCGQPVPARQAPPDSVVPQVQPEAPASVPPPPSPAPTTAPPPPAHPEPVLGIIPYVEERAGLLRTSTYNLVFTPQRMVLATVTSRMMQEAARQAAEEAKRQGQGFLARMGATMQSREALWQRYLSMPVQAILAEHSGNSFLLRSHIRRVRVEQDDDEDNPVDRLVLETTSGKREFALKGATAAEAQKLLRSILGDVVR